MASRLQILMRGEPVTADFYDLVQLLEIEENADLPGALQLRLPASRTEEGDLSSINDDGLQPMANIAVLVTSEGKPSECIFDGYVLSQKLHLESGITASHVEVYAQDASWLMNLEEKTREWRDVTDGAVANAIFSEYGVAPSPDNLDDDSPSHTEDGHTLMQRATDLQFLQMLARRTGKLCRVTCGNAPGARIGIFAKPNLDRQRTAALHPNDPEAPNVRALDIEWDVMRPNRVAARQALFTDDAEEGASGDTDATGLAPMDARDLSSFVGQPMTTMLTATTDSGGELSQRAQGVLRDASWFVRCTGETDVSSLRTVLRVGSVVGLEAIGSVHSGNYLVWSVRHRIHTQSHRMRFVLMRNAVGPAPRPARGGLLGGLI